jgi:Cysteine-rich CPXCG
MISNPNDDGRHAQHNGEVGDWRDEFPLGDGTAETSATVYCPYCNESIQIAIDPGGGTAQEYVEDCEVCCQPWAVSVRYQPDGTASVTVTALDE